MKSTGRINYNGGSKIVWNQKKTVRIWNLEDRKLETVIGGFESEVIAVAIANDNLFIVFSDYWRVVSYNLLPSKYEEELPGMKISKSR